ncbi:MAG: hypothetical protein WCE94_02805 [Candidatus Methanoperedens sp.]
MDLITGGIGFVIGAVGSAVALFKYLTSRLSPEEVESIRIRLTTAINDYKKAKEDGVLTADEQLKLAEDALAVVEETLKALET